MPITLKITEEGIDRAVTMFEGMAANCEDFTPVWDEIHERVNRFLGQWIGTSGDGSYKPLAPATLGVGAHKATKAGRAAVSVSKSKRRRSPRPFDTLSRWGWNSLTHKGAPGHVFNTTKTTCEIGAEGVMHWHIKDRSDPSRNWFMPARPPIPRDAQKLNELSGLIVEAMAAHITGRERYRGYSGKGPRYER